MRIADVKALPAGTTVRVVAGNWAGCIATLHAVRRYEGLQRAGVVIPTPHEPRLGGALVWVRPAEIEV